MRRKVANELIHAVGERLELTREVLGITQTEFARRAGMSRTAYNMIENGERPLHVEDALKIREAHHVSLDWIYCGDTAGLRHEMATAIEGMSRYREVLSEYGMIDPDGKGPIRRRKSA